MNEEYIFFCEELISELYQLNITQKHKPGLAFRVSQTQNIENYQKFGYQ